MTLYPSNIGYKDPPPAPLDPELKNYTYTINRQVKKIPIVTPNLLEQNFI